MYLASWVVTAGLVEPLLAALKDSEAELQCVSPGSQISPLYAHQCKSTVKTAPSSSLVFCLDFSSEGRVGFR